VAQQAQMPKVQRGHPRLALMTEVHPEQVEGKDEEVVVGKDEEVVVAASALPQRVAAAWLHLPRLPGP